MSKKSRMGRNLNALLGSSTRTRETAAKPVEAGAEVEAAAENSTTPVAGEGARQTPNAVVDLSERSQVKPAAAAAQQAPKPEKPQANVQIDAEQEAKLQSGDKLRVLGVDQISRGTYQPRRHFDPVLLQELADSLTAQGLIQPILVRPYGGSYELIAGERRWRAAQLAGITEIPAIVRDLDDQSVAAVSLIENIQRADLNPLEEATALERLCEEFSMTHQAVADAVGRSRASVTNLMRLLELDAEVKMLVDEGKIDMGHARALLGAPASEQASIARRIVSQDMTVRAVEKLVKSIREGKSGDAQTKNNAPDPNIEALKRKLGDILGAPVAVKHKKNGAGTLEITYSSVDELEGILRHIK